MVAEMLQRKEEVMFRKMLCVIAVVAFAVSLVSAGEYMILNPDGTCHKAVKVGDKWIRADSEDEMLVRPRKFDPGYVDVLAYYVGTGWYYPNRGEGSWNGTWFSPPAACSLMVVSFYWYSPGDAAVYVWDSPFPYVAGMQSSQLEDSMYKYWVYDTTIATSVTGWTSLPTAIVDGAPLTSNSSADGSSAWADLDLTPFGGPFDLPEGSSFWLAYMITDPTFGGRPWPLSEDGCCIDVPGRSWQYRTTRNDPPSPYYNFYCYADATGDWCFEATVYVYGNPAPEISMDRIPDTYATGPYSLTLNIKDKPNDMVTRAKVYWNVNGGPAAPYDSADLTAVDSIQYTGTISATASPGDTIYYYIEADDEQPKTNFLPPAGKFAPWNFIVREKTCNNLFVYGSDNVDPLIMDMLDELNCDYDLWDANGYVTGRSYGAPDASVLGAGFQSIVWCTWGGPYFADAADAVMDYLDGGGNLLLSGSDAFSNYVGTYDHIVLDPAIHPLATDYFHFTEITDDFHPGADDPAFLYGAESDVVAGPFSEDLLLFNPAYTWSGQSDWMGMVAHDGSVTEIFFDESDVATGYRYEDATKGYKYVFTYWNISGLSNQAYDDTLGVPDSSNMKIILFNSLVWFGSLTGTDEVVTSNPAFNLSQNRPNPVNSATNIMYAVPNASRVSLKVYDVTGRVVRTLVDKKVDAGNHVAAWDGKDNKGNEVVSGVYFYKLMAGKDTATKKLVVVK